MHWWLFYLKKIRKKLRNSYFHPKEGTKYLQETETTNEKVSWRGIQHLINNFFHFIILLNHIIKGSKKKDFIKVNFENKLTYRQNVSETSLLRLENFWVPSSCLFFSFMIAVEKKIIWFAWNLTRMFKCWAKLPV